MFKFGVALACSVFLLFLVACGAAAPSPSLEVYDQDVQGNAVSIPKAAIDKAGWLVLHGATSEGKPDPASNLAVVRLGGPGEYLNIKVPLYVLGERTIFAMLHYDNPVDGAFTFSTGKADDPPVTVEGNVLVKSFVARGVSPMIEVQSQEIKGGKITLSRAVIDKAGWLILHPTTTEGKPDTARNLAIVKLSPGEYTNIEVPLSISVPNTVFAMLYYDDPADGSFTYSSGKADDPPVRTGGNIVVVYFTVYGQ